MLSDFNKAQDLLKTKLNDVLKEKEAIEEKYNNRESRAEDIEAIEQFNVRNVFVLFIM